LYNDSTVDAVYDRAYSKSGGTDIIRILSSAAWAPLAVFIAHLFLGRLFGHEPYVDPVMHFCGGMAIAYFFQETSKLASHWVGKLTDMGRALFAFGLACAAAVLWEIGEFSSDIVFRTHVQINNANTMRDLILGVVGASLFLVIGQLMRRSRP
jgi:Na+-translocating ferredoxin:NAD+ oxidoreductase RnfD subunit